MVLSFMSSVDMTYSNVCACVVVAKRLNGSSWFFGAMGLLQKTATLY